MHGVAPKKSLGDDTGRKLPTKMATIYTRVFRGRTEAEIETKFLEWQRENFWRVINIRPYPIERLSRGREMAEVRPGQP